MPWREWSDLRSLSGLLGIKWSRAWSSQSQVKQYTPKVLSWPICKSQVVTKLLACSQLDSCIWSYEQNNPELIMYFNAAITSYLWLTISTNLQILIIPKFWPSWILNKNDSTVIKLNVFFLFTSWCLFMLRVGDKGRGVSICDGVAGYNMTF